MVMVPATVSNNVPGSDLSIGADTALNAITHVSAAGRPAHRYTRQTQQGLRLRFTSFMLIISILTQNAVQCCHDLGIMDDWVQISESCD